MNQIILWTVFGAAIAAGVWFFVAMFSMIAASFEERENER